MHLALIVFTLLTLACNARAKGYGPSVGIPGAAGIMGGAGSRWSGAGGFGSHGSGFGSGAFGPGVGSPGLAGVGGIGSSLAGSGGFRSIGSRFGSNAFSGQAGLGAGSMAGLPRPSGMGPMGSGPAFIPGSSYPMGPPQPYSSQYEAPDGQGGASFRTESGDMFGAKIGSYGYTDAQGLYRLVQYVADENGFRAVVYTNEPGVDGTENPADVIMNVEKTPYGIQEQYTPAQAYGTGLTGLGGYRGISGVRPGLGGIYTATGGVRGIGLAGQGSPFVGTSVGLGAGRPAIALGAVGATGVSVPALGAGVIRQASYGGTGGLSSIGMGGSRAFGALGGVTSPFGSIPKSTSKKSSY